jgi:hypothetical protein
MMRPDRRWEERKQIGKWLLAFAAFMFGQAFVDFWLEDNYATRLTDGRWVWPALFAVAGFSAVVSAGRAYRGTVAFWLWLCLGFAIHSAVVVALMLTIPSLAAVYVAGLSVASPVLLIAWLKKRGYCLLT